MVDRLRYSLRRRIDERSTRDEWLFVCRSSLSSICRVWVRRVDCNFCVSARVFVVSSVRHGMANSFWHGWLRPCWLPSAAVPSLALSSVALPLVALQLVALPLVALPLVASPSVTLPLTSMPMKLAQSTSLALSNYDAKVADTSCWSGSNWSNW
jgi:hypothetical protein